MKRYLIVAAALSAALSQPVFAQTSTLPATIPSAQPNIGDADCPAPCPSARFNKKVRTIRTDIYDLAMIGDSITETVGDARGEWIPLKAVWSKYFAPHNAINLGYSGYRTENILWQLQNGELDFKQSPKVITLLIGTNNTDDQNYREIHTGEQVFAGVKAIVGLIREKHPSSKILILRPFPCGGPGSQTTYQRKYNRSETAMGYLRRAGELSAGLADGKQVFWLDIGHVFLRPDGSINTDLMPDLIHPNAAGAEAWAQAIEPTLAQLLGVKSIVDPQPNSAVIPAAKLEENGYDWLGRHNEIIKLGKQIDPEVVFIGDSLTHGWGGLPAGHFKHAQKNTLDKVFSGFRTLNLGFGWDRTQNILLRIDHGELDGIHPRAVVLHIGTNNTSGTANARQNTPDEIVAGIRACVIRIRAKLPDAKIILMSVFPRENSPDHPRRQLINEINKRLATELGNQSGITILDLGPKLCNPDGTLPRDVAFDYCHLTDKGYQIWSDALLPLLQEQSRVPANPDTAPAIRQ